MFTDRTIIAASGVTITDVGCHDEPAGWSVPEPVTRRTVVLIRSGLFQRKVNGRESLLDSSTGYLSVPGTEASLAHPAGDDRCTSIALPEEDLEILIRSSEHPEMIITNPRLGLDHRAMIARARAGATSDEIAERAHVLVGSALASGELPITTATIRRGIDLVRQLLAADRSATLDDLARAAGLSPYHLSRSFRHATGLTITAYRIRLQLRDALERLAAGQLDLAVVAADSGFSDQAHLTRLLRRETGTTPARARHLLSSAT